MRLYLTEADKSRFINKIWPQIELNATDIMETVGQNINAKLSGTELPTKDSVIAFANSNASDKYKIDWNDFNSHDNDTLWDVTIKLLSSFLSYNTSRKNKKDPKKQFQNEHFEILHENENWLFVAVLDYKGAIYCDSYRCGGAGAKWCIGYEKEDKYWTDYINQGKRFVLVYDKSKYADNFLQKFMLELDNSDSYDQQIACKGWKQSDDPEDTLSIEDCCSIFGITKDLLVKWYNKVKDLVKIDYVDTFSMKDVMNGQKVYLSNKNGSVYLKDFDCERFNYSNILENVKFEGGISELISKSDNGNLLLSSVIMGATNVREFNNFTNFKYRLPKILIWGYDTVMIPDLWISGNSPQLCFMNCKRVLVGTLHLPASFDSKETDVEKLIKEFNREYGSDNLIFDNSPLLVTLGIKYFPRANYCVQYPDWVQTSENASALVTKYQIQYAIHGRKEKELLSNCKRAYIDFDGNEKYFTDKSFDISKVVIDVPDESGPIYCINVPIGCSVIYSKYPEADIRIRYCNCKFKFEESMNLKTKDFGDWAVTFWKKGSKVLHIAQNQGEPNTTNYWMVGTTTRQFDYESGWLPNKEWTSTIKGHFSKEKAIQIAKENAMKENKGLKEGRLGHIKDRWQSELDKGIEPEILMDPWTVCEGMKWLGKDGWIRVEEVLIPTEYEEPYPDFYMEIFDQHTCKISHDIYTINEINSYVKETKARLVNNGIKSLVNKDMKESKLKERVLDYDTYDEFYKKGCEAYFEGKSLDEVPVTGNAWFREAWQEGWKDSKAADDEDVRRAEAEYEDELEREDYYSSLSESESKLTESRVKLTKNHDNIVEALRAAIASFQSIGVQVQLLEEMFGQKTLDVSYGPYHVFFDTLDDEDGLYDGYGKYLLTLPLASESDVQWIGGNENELFADLKDVFNVLDKIMAEPNKNDRNFAD